MIKLSESEIRQRFLDLHNLKNRLRDMKERQERYKEKLREKKEREKELEEENKSLKDKVRDLERELREMAQAKTAKCPKFPNQNYGLSTQGNQNRKQSTIRGKRNRKVEREKEVTREVLVYPQDVDPQVCFLFESRIITHINEGKKETVKYLIYREKTSWGKNGKRGKIEGVLPYTEYGMEVGLVVTYLVNELGLSRSQTQSILSFFCHLEISISQIDNLLSQVSKVWEKEFETISDIIVLASVVYMDETGWRVGKENCYTWIFRSLTHTVLLYGEDRSESVLDKILPRKLFGGTAVSDCYGIYVNRFDEAQKCWAHFLRKIIKLHLLYPDNKEYKWFLKNLGKIFSDSKQTKMANSPPLEKKTEVRNFKKQIQKICTRKNEKLNKETLKEHREFVNLQKSLIKNIDDLFTFVLKEGVDPTSNKAERGLRKTALMRNAYQTSKTKDGAYRRSILTSVLSSLKQNLPIFSLDTVLEEVVRWQNNGHSLFDKQLATLRN